MHAHSRSLSALSQANLCSFTEAGASSSPSVCTCFRAYSCIAQQGWENNGFDKEHTHVSSAYTHTHWNRSVNSIKAPQRPGNNPRMQRGERNVQSFTSHSEAVDTWPHSAPQSASINNRVNWASGNVWKTLTNLSLNHLYFQILGKTASAPQVIKLLVCFNRSQKMCVYMHLCTNHTFRWFFLSLMLKLESWFLYVRWSSHRPGPHLHISPGKHHFLLRKQVWNGCLHLHKSTDYRRRRGK